MEGYYVEIIVGLSFLATLLALLSGGLWYEVRKQRRIATTLGSSLDDVLTMSARMVKEEYRK